MTIQVFMDNVEVPVKHISFSDGGSNIRVLWPGNLKPQRNITLTVKPETPVNSVQFELFLALDSIYSQIGVFDTFSCNLNLPYLPHARADRRFDEHSAFPLHEFLRFLPPFQEIYLTDPHSDWFPVNARRLGRKVHVKEQHECFMELNVPVDEYTLLIAPDDGAAPKVAKFNLYYIQATKERNPDNGRIIATHLPNGGYEGMRCIIVDDICDGGGTFLPLAEALRAKGAASVELYVTHGIFAKGLDPFKGLIDKLHVYQIVGNYISREDLAAFNNTSWSTQ